MKTRVLSGLAGLFTRNLELKFLALVIALVIFYSRTQEEMADRTLLVDLMTLGEESLGDRVRVSPLPSKLEVKVRGPSNVVAALRPDDVGPAAVRIGEALAEGRVVLQRGMFRLPEGVRVLSIYPQSIDFRFERRLSRTLPVIADFGPLDPDVVIDPVGTDVQPRRIEVSGPESAVGTLEDFHTERIELQGRTAGTLERDVALVLPASEHVVTEVQMVRVRITVRPDVVESERPGVPVEVVQGRDLDPAGTLVYGAEGLRASVRVRGLRSVVEALPSDDLRLFCRVDRSRFTDENGDGVLEAAVPVEAERSSERWEVVGIEPATVSMVFVPPPAPPPVPETPPETPSGTGAPAPVPPRASAVP